MAKQSLPELKESTYQTSSFLLSKVKYLILGKEIFFTGINGSPHGSTINYAEKVVKGICIKEDIAQGDYTFYDVETHIQYRESFVGENHFYCVDRLVFKGDLVTGWHTVASSAKKHRGQPEERTAKIELAIQTICTFIEFGKGMDVESVVERTYEKYASSLKKDFQTPESALSFILAEARHDRFLRAVDSFYYKDEYQKDIFNKMYWAFSAIMYDYLADREQEAFLSEYLRSADDEKIQGEKLILTTEQAEILSRFVQRVHHQYDPTQTEIDLRSFEAIRNPAVEYQDRSVDAFIQPLKLITKKKARVAYLLDHLQELNLVQRIRVMLSVPAGDYALFKEEKKASEEFDEEYHSLVVNMDELKQR